MQFKNLIEVLFLSLLLTSAAMAQDLEKTTTLKLQLIDLQAQEEDLRLRLQVLDEQLKPENIERSLAGVGSTRPEELREQRRRQLTIEKNAVASRLNMVQATRARLEAQVASDEVEAYQQSAQPSPAPTDQMLAATPVNRWLVLIAGGVTLVSLLTAGLFLIRARRFN